MKVVSENIYHIYNQGNNHQKIFFDREDYLLFLKFYRKFVANNCETLSYCLMPNHFHFLIYTTVSITEEIKLRGIQIQKLSDGFRRLLSTYAQEINAKNNTSGSLFRQKTKAKLLQNDIFILRKSYTESCFHYIYHNPYSSNLVENILDWQFSSALAYFGLRRGTICNQELALILLN